MSFSIDVRQLRERASQRVKGTATVATLLPGEGSKVAMVARYAETIRTGNDGMLTAERAVRSHAPSWTDAEIETFSNRRDRLLRWGYREHAAEHLAERLLWRDRDLDDRRVCAECRYGSSRRCPDGTPLPDVLQRCPAFTEEK